MTPPGSTEQMYLISESEMKEYSRLLADDHSGSFALVSKVEALAKKYEDEFRARGPVVQQAPARQNICQICASGQQEPFCIGCYHLKEHDAAIAAQAREDVLKRLHLVVPLCDALIEKFDCQSQLGFNALLIKRELESLRSEVKKP